VVRNPVRSAPRPRPGGLLRGLFAAGLLAALAPGVGNAFQGESARCRTDYRIEARLDGETKRITGTLEVDWSNESGEEVDDLWFHLYLNAFSNNRSTHLQEARGEPRGFVLEDGWGWSQVRSIEVAGQGDGGWQDVFPTMRYRRPDDDRLEDRTVFSVDLPRPVPSGSKLTVRIAWESQLPRVRRRTGYKDDFLLVAQWFPKLGVYETGRGWNCHQFHMSSEFYSDYGTYDVELNLPPEYEGKVFASGVTTEQIVGGRLEVKVQAPSALDRLRLAERFPDEIERVREILGPGEDVELRNVDITVLVHPERKGQIARHVEATSAALFFYGLWFGEYPYQHITVVDPPWGGRAAGGMEYPTLFTCGTRLFTTEDMYVPESVTVHEAGHQFWYGLVGNNEFEAAWLDEGFNSFTDSEVLLRVYGPSRETTDYARLPFDGVAVGGKPGGGPVAEALTLSRVSIPIPYLTTIELEPVPRSGFLDLWRDQPAHTFVQAWTDPRWGDRGGYLREPDVDPIERRAWDYVDRESYGTNSYRRPAVALRSLPAVIGHGPFLRGMRHYARTWRYRHPYPDDFYATFQEGADVDVQWYFEELFQGTGTVDWSVAVSQERRPDPSGFFQSEGGEFFERPQEEEEAEGEDDAPWVIDIEVRRNGELSLPVDVRLTYEDGTTETVDWSREEQLGSNWLKLERTSEQKLVSAVVDPDRAYFIDTDMSNNGWYDEVDQLAPWRWGERVLAGYQRYFHWIAGIGG
jgi:hypothetical protein